ncbi:hypothetical protein [Pseudoduganella violaceinigra]|uniref:hypothetical protein n=1 Tax=Pseudoduganella violaceinigra TaxID=246602 RepID=UPI0004273874|nr:hypothetical protein [Pseudoduganella violaceinigra]
MYAFSNDFSRAAEAAFDAQLASFANFFDWHRDTALASLAAMTSASNEFLTVKHPQDLLQMASDQGKHAMDRAQAFGREATDVALNKPLFR